MMNYSIYFKYIIYAILLTIIITISYKYGYDNGSNKQIKTYMEQELKNLEDLNKKASEYNNVSLQYQNEITKDENLIRGLKSENHKLHDNLNNCTLSNNRVQSIQHASKNVYLSNTATASDGVNARVNPADISCHDVVNSYIACADVYHTCQNRLSELQDWINIHKK